MGAYFSGVELDNVIRFTIVSTMPGLPWHSSKWACQFGHFLQYTARSEILTCSLNTDLNCIFPWTTKILNAFSMTDKILLKSSSAPSWSRVPWLNFPAKYMNFQDPSWLSCSFYLLTLSLYVWLIYYLLNLN